MIFSTLTLNNDSPIYMQIADHVLNCIKSGELKKGSKLPSTREVGSFLKISRNSVITAYEYLESDEIIATKKGVGTFVLAEFKTELPSNDIDYLSNINEYAKNLRSLDIIKTASPYKKGMISFKSIAPNSELFNTDDFKRALMDAWTFEENNLLNYGYAKGYKPLIDYFLEYMKEKRADTTNKDILITNGFTEAFDILISSLTNKGDTILCEEPTHNTALKIMKSYGLNIVQIPMDKDGIILKELEKKLSDTEIKLAYLIPSYNNPTGIVTKADRRKKIFEILNKHHIPIIEDGFNEELLYSSSPAYPLISLAGTGNGVIYIGSLSKILFPGLRIGWIFADSKLVDTLESVKRGRSIHCSFLDQSAFYYYLKSGAFNRYLKQVRKYYRDKFELVVKMINKYIPYEYITGEGGLHVFLKLKNNIDSSKLFDMCYKDNVIFMPGDIFFADSLKGKDTLRIGFGHVSDEDIKKGIKIIGKNVEKMTNDI